MNPQILASESRSASVAGSAGARLVASDGRELVLTRIDVRADACAGVARVELVQHFSNPFDDPLDAQYLLPLPLEGAVSAFRFEVGDETVHGRVERRAAARAQYEQAVLDGHVAVLLEQERGTLFQQQVGNIPPRATVVARIGIDQRLRWVDGGWEWRFPTVVAPRYLGGPGRVPDAGRVTVPIADRAIPAVLDVALTVRDPLPAGPPRALSHPMDHRAEGPRVRSLLRGAVPDRDVVVHWAVAEAEPGLVVDVARPDRRHGAGDEAFVLLTLVPPRAPRRSLPRDVILLVDTSGSMAGRPLEMACAVLRGVIASLGECDTLEMIEFSTHPRRWSRGARAIDARARAESLAWVDGLRAGGATEMHTAVLEALRPLRAEAQRQVVLVTDGHIGFEQEIVAAVLAGLPEGCRLHTVGVGASVNRDLLEPAARAGRGHSTLVGVDDDVEDRVIDRHDESAGDVVRGEARPSPVTAAVERIVAALDAPVLVDVAVSGACLREMAPARVVDLMARQPATVLLRVDPAGGELQVAAGSLLGRWTRTVAIPPVDAGTGSTALPVLFAHEAVADLELQVGAAGRDAQLDRRIEAIGLQYRIATRLTSWVAVAQSSWVDPQAPRRRRVVAHAAPYGMAVEAFGLRATRRRQPMACIFRSDALMEPPYPDLASMLAAPSRSASMAESAREYSPLPDVPAPRMSRMPARRTLRGRLVRHLDDTVWIEVELDEDLRWRIGETVTVGFDDGDTMTAGVDARQTTRNGHYVAGQQVRLVLQTVRAGITSVELDHRTMIEIAA